MTAPDPGADVGELAVWYATGLLKPTEAEAFENRLLAGDPACRQEFARVQPAADMLLKLARPVDPTLLSRSNLINSLGLPKAVAPFGAERTPDLDPLTADPLGMVLFRASDFEWTDLPTPGARMRYLYVDRERRRASLLIKLDPGTVFPDHDHPDVEECLVLEGDLELGGKVMRKFDYMRIPKGGQHGTPRTTNGCIVLVTCGIAA